MYFCPGYWVPLLIVIAEVILRHVLVINSVLIAVLLTVFCGGDIAGLSRQYCGFYRGITLFRTAPGTIAVTTQKNQLCWSVGGVDEIMLMSRNIGEFFVRPRGSSIDRLIASR